MCVSVWGIVCTCVFITDLILIAFVGSFVGPFAAGSLAVQYGALCKLRALHLLPPHHHLQADLTAGPHDHTRVG